MEDVHKTINLCHLRGLYLISVMEHDNSFHDRRPFIWLPAQAKWVNVIVCSNRYLTKQL